MPFRNPLAVVTMAFNEPLFLTVWQKHYDRQVGSRNCYVVDHGSDERSTGHLDCNVIRLPRTPFNESHRAASMSDFCASLLHYYRAVLYTDCDEMVVADPNVAASLVEYADLSADIDCVTAFGIDVLHDESREPKLDWHRSILSQRRIGRPQSGLCKPTFIRKAQRWAEGFHIPNDGIPVFRDLYLFHLAYADAETLVERQRRRNATPPAGKSDSHHLIAPEVLRDHISDLARRPSRAVELAGCEAMQTFINNLAADQGFEVWELPARFRSCL